MSEPATFKLRPRYRNLGLSAVGVGGVLAVLGGVSMVLAPLIAGVIGAALGSAYLMSPAWRLVIVVDDAGLEVRSPDKVRFRLAWTSVVRVLAAPNSTCYVDGGSPEKSLIVPGVGAVAPYDIADKARLCELILARVPADKITRVESLEAARAAQAAAATAPPPA